MKIIDGKELAKKVREEVKEKLKSDKYKSIPAPHLIVIQVGDNEASNLYINNKKKACEEVGIKCSIYKYEENITTEKLKDIIGRLSLDPLVTGILIQLPLPDHIDERTLIDEIDPIKDVDGFTCVQAGMLQLGIKDKHRLEPCTAKGIVRLLESIIDLEGKDITVVGRSNIVGKPVAQLLQEKNATVTLCHSKSQDIGHSIIESDAVVLAIGKPKYFGARYFYNAQDLIIIDAGINTDKNGKLCGDLCVEHLEMLYDSPSYKYTPVPGGVGPMTITSLLENICIAYDAQFDNIWKYHEKMKNI